MSHDAPITGDETPFDILGVSIDATDDEIRTRFHLLTQMFHPDHCNSPDAHDNYIRIKFAYEMLKDPVLRTRIVSEIRERTWQQVGLYDDGDDDDDEFGPDVPVYWHPSGDKLFPMLFFGYRNLYTVDQVRVLLARWDELLQFYTDYNRFDGIEIDQIVDDGELPVSWLVEDGTKYPVLNLWTGKNNPSVSKIAVILENRQWVEEFLDFYGEFEEGVVGGD